MGGDMEESMRIMIVDDEQIVRESLFYWFEKAGYRAEASSSGFEALERLETSVFDLMFVDIKMPGMDGMELLEKIKAEYPETVVVIMTAYGSIESAIRAMKTGAADYLLKPFKPDQLSLVMEKILQQQRLATQVNYLKGHLEKMTRFDDIIGQSAPMEEIFRILPEIAGSDASVLLTGETGTGKELIAKAVHAKSGRAERPFIAINCGALSDSLLESELFGHQKGAFTGAVRMRKGFLEVVSGGTLFLDEVGEVSPKMQIDLLRVLEEKRITRIGSTESVDVDFRLVCATRKALEQEMAEGRFREDFFYRINVIHIPVPPLRQRREDIPLLVAHFLEKYSQETAKQVDRVSRDAMEQLKGYDWPGNVRELENAVERAVVLARSRRLAAADFSFLRPPSERGTGDRTLREMERRHILGVLAETGWNVTQAAGILGSTGPRCIKKSTATSSSEPFFHERSQDITPGRDCVTGHLKYAKVRLRAQSRQLRHPVNAFGPFDIKKTKHFTRVNGHLDEDPCSPYRRGLPWKCPGNCCRSHCSPHRRLLEPGSRGPAAPGLSILRPEPPAPSIRRRPDIAEDGNGPVRRNGRQGDRRRLRGPVRSHLYLRARRSPPGGAYGGGFPVPARREGGHRRGAGAGRQGRPSRALPSLRPVPLHRRALPHAFFRRCGRTGPHAVFLLPLLRGLFPGGGGQVEG